jgi:23S rRNA (uridine2552-2'-O)-methyltransferase
MHADNWANKAKQMGYRSRAVFKLEEILQKFDSKKRYQNVLDLGSSPGGWSQYIIKKYNSSMVFAIDILDMEPIDGVNFYQESIECIDNISEIKKLKGSFNLVISDIAPNLSGIGAIDNENIYDLNQLTVMIAKDYLSIDGALIMKTFQNNMLKKLRKEMEIFFKVVQTYKPAASKKQSGEIYLFGVK